MRERERERKGGVKTVKGAVDVQTGPDFTQTPRLPQSHSFT